MMDRVLELILVVVIIGATLAFGGVQPLAYSLMEAAILVVFSLLVLRQTGRGKINLPLPVWPVAFAGFVLLQAIPLPPGLLNALSPARESGLPPPGLNPDVSKWETISIYPHDTFLQLVAFLAYLAAFVLAAYFFDSRERKSLLVRGLMVLACFEAGYGIVQYLTGWQKIFTYTKQFDLEEATGTYINRNHFAGLLELTLPFVLAMAFYVYQVWSERLGRQSRRSRYERQGPVGFQLAFYLFLAALLAAAAVFSRSRGGILAMAAALVFMFLVVQLKTRRKGWALAGVLFLGGVAGLTLWIGLNPVLARFDQISEPSFVDTQLRFNIWRDTLQVVRDYPLAGIGLGTYAVGYRHYQTIRPDAHVPHAHNDYLQIASETGLIGFALLFVPIFYLFVKMVISFLRDTRRYRSAITLGCMGSTVGLMIHSVTDFNLQIPANALIFAVVLGTGYKAASVEPRDEAQPSGSGVIREGRIADSQPTLGYEGGSEATG